MNRLAQPKWFPSRTLSPAWYAALTAILLLAVLMRLWSINKESFWADEGWTVVLSHGPTLSDVVQTMAYDQHPPLYFVLFHYWTLLVSDSELTSRLLSAFWSLIGVALVYRLGADRFSRQAGALGALVMSLAALDLMMAQEARHYTQMATLALLSTVFYFRYRKHPTRALGLGWWAASVALMYTHYLGAFILLIQLLHIVLTARRIQSPHPPTPSPSGRGGARLYARLPLYRLRERELGSEGFFGGEGHLFDLLIRWLLIGLAWTPWAFVFIAQSSIRYTRPILFRSALSNSPETFVTIRSAVFGAHFGLTVGLMLLGLLYVTYRSGQWPVIRWRAAQFARSAAPTLYLALWVVVPTAVMFAINTKFEIVTPRNFLLILPAVAVLIGHGLTNLERTARLFLVAILVVIGLTTVDAYFVKPPWRQVARDIVDYRLADEPVIMDVWVDDYALRYHISRDYGVYSADLPLISIPSWLERYQTNFFPDLLNYVSDKQSLWMADWGKDEDGVLSFLADHGFVQTATQIETHLDTNLIRVYRYDRLPTTPPLAAFGSMLTLARTNIPASVTRGAVLPVSLWFSVKADPGKDYSVSAFLLDSSGRLVAQHDGSPLDGKSPMSGWHTGDYRFDQPHVTIAQTLAPGTYQVGVKVYWYADPKPLPVTGQSVAPDGTYVILGSVSIQ